MKTHIYIIRNSINDKVYIGQTRLSLEERFMRHISDSKRNEKWHRPLYNAIRKFGENKFYIELIEDCDSSLADAKEMYWIKQYNSNNENGYNATIGGTMYEPYDYDYVAELITAGYTTREIMQKIGCCKQLVYRVANTYDLVINGSKHNQTVAQYSLDNEFLNKFNSVAEASRYIKSLIDTDTEVDTIRKNISRRCRSDKYNVAYNFIWKFINENDAV